MPGIVKQTIQTVGLFRQPPPSPHWRQLLSFPGTLVDRKCLIPEGVLVLNLQFRRVSYVFNYISEVVVYWQYNIHV